MIARVKKLAGRLHQDTAGAMSVEKIMILAIIALPIVITLILFRDKLYEWFGSQTKDLNTTQGTVE